MWGTLLRILFPKEKTTLCGQPELKGQLSQRIRIFWQTMEAVMQSANQMVLSMVIDLRGLELARNPVQRCQLEKQFKRREGNNLQFGIHLSDVKLPEHVLVEGVIDITADPS